MFLRVSIVIIICCFLPYDNMAQYYSKYYNFGQNSNISFDLGNQLIEAGDVIYLKTRSFKGDKEIVSISILDAEGNILKTRDIDWGVALNTHFMFKDGDRLLYIQSDDNLTNTWKRHGIQLLELNGQLDSLSYHYYPSEYSSEKLICMPIEKHRNDYIIGTTSHFGAFDYRIGLLSINVEDFSRDTIRYPFLGRAPEIRFLKSLGDSLILGYSLLNFETAGVPSPQNYISLFNKNFDSMWTWNPWEISEAFGLDHNPRQLIYEYQDESIIFDHTARGHQGVNRIDLNGDLIWSERKSNDPYFTTEFFGYLPTRDGNFIGYGYGISVEKNEEDKSFAFNSGYLQKVDLEDGSVIWEHLLMDYNDNGASKGHAVGDLIELNNGDLVGVGQSFPNKDWKPSGNELIDFMDVDTWLFKVDSEGCFRVLSCDGLWSHTSGNLDTEQEYSSKIELYPNPVQNTLYINSQGNFEEITYAIMNIHGQKIFQGEFDLILSRQIDVSILNQGVYILELKTFNKTTILKFIKK